MASYRPVSSPTFGGCRSPFDVNIITCALDASYCSQGSLYVKPHEVPGGLCDNPFKVGVGRCTATVDKKVCSSVAEACEIQNLFKPDDDCNLVRDHNNDSFGTGTHFPTCGDNGTNRCVLSRDYCEVGESFHQIDKFVWRDSCHCDNVPTGICYMDDVSPVTSHSSFCAVTEDDCPDSYAFMSAVDLLKMIDAPRRCNLCRPVDLATGGTMNDDHIVESGGCYDATSDSFLQCALQSTDCPSNTTFSSSVQMRNNGDIPCKSDEIRVGRCTSGLDEIGCTGDKSGCYMPAAFQPHDQSCTVHSDVATQEPTFYGMCRESSASGKGGNWRKHRCTWQDTECKPDEFEIWWHGRKPQENWLASCNCEHVETGGCSYYDGQDQLYHCAVSKYACDDPSSYLKSYEMEALGYNCKLCQTGSRDEAAPSPSAKKVPTQPPRPTPTKPTLTKPTPSPPTTPATNPTNLTSPTSNEKSGGGGNDVELGFGITAIVLAVAVSGFFVARQVVRRKRAKQMEVTGEPTVSNENAVEA